MSQQPVMHYGLGTLHILEHQEKVVERARLDDNGEFDGEDHAETPADGARDATELALVEATTDPGTDAVLPLLPALLLELLRPQDA